MNEEKPITSQYDLDQARYYFNRLGTDDCIGPQEASYLKHMIRQHLAAAGLEALPELGDKDAMQKIVDDKYKKSCALGAEHVLVGLDVGHYSGSAYAMERAVQYADACLKKASGRSREKKDPEVTALKRKATSWRKRVAAAVEAEEAAIAQEIAPYLP